MKQEKIFPVSVRALNPKEMHAYAIEHKKLLSEKLSDI